MSLIFSKSFNFQILAISDTFYYIATATICEYFLEYQVHNMQKSLGTYELMCAVAVVEKIVTKALKLDGKQDN